LVTVKESAGIFLLSWALPTTFPFNLAETRKLARAVCQRGDEVDEHLTTAGLVAALHAAIRDGEMPPAGTAAPAARAVEQLAEGLAPVVGPDLVCVMVGAPGVTTTFHGFDGLRRAWEDWGETFSELELMVTTSSKYRPGRSCSRVRSG
jgi:hypothetical protein